VTDAVVAAARGAAGGPVEVTGTAVAVPVIDPARDNPALIAAIVDAKGKIRFVTDATTSLEDAYLTLLGGTP